MIHNRFFDKDSYLRALEVLRQPESLPLPINAH